MTYILPVLVLDLLEWNKVVLKREILGDSADISRYLMPLWNMVKASRIR